MSGFSAGGASRAQTRDTGVASRPRGGISRGTDAADRLSRHFPALESFLCGFLRRARVCAATLLPLMLSGCVFLGTQEQGAVGVIGGSDGPTSIFLTFNADPRANVTLLVVLGIIVVIAAIILIRRGRKNKK